MSGIAVSEIIELPKTASLIGCWRSFQFEVLRCINSSNNTNTITTTTKTEYTRATMITQQNMNGKWFPNISSPLSYPMLFCMCVCVCVIPPIPPHHYTNNWTALRCVLRVRRLVLVWRLTSQAQATNGRRKQIQWTKISVRIRDCFPRLIYFFLWWWHLRICIRLRHPKGLRICVILIN